jgi:hypothetical protein
MKWFWIILAALATALLVTLAYVLAVALAPVAAAHAGLLGAIALALIVLTALGGLRILFAYGRRAAALARQAEIVTMQNGHPTHINDISIYAALIPRSLDRFYDAEQIRAAISPALTHYHNEVHATPALPPPDGLLSISGPPRLPAGGLAHLRQIGHVCRSGNSLPVGYSGQAPQYIELPECGFVGIGGQPRVGKSTTTLLLINQAVLSGWHVFIGDPHITKADGLLNRCRPLSGRLAKQAVTPEEIAGMVRLVDKIGRRRVQGDADRTPVLMIIDEFTNLVWREALPDDVLRILPSMAIEYAGVGVHGIIISHDWSKGSLGGDLGAALRRAITHRVIHRMDPGNVEFLLPKGSAAQARAVQGLEKGQALYFGPDGAATVAVPLVGDEDAAYAAQGAPERPYVPRQAQIAAAPAPATPPAPRRAVPPTVELPPATVQAQILMLLDVRPWLTSTEIAGHLQIDLQVIRVELTTLKNQRALTRRAAPDHKSDKYEWSLSKPLNELMADRVALSA